MTAPAATESASTTAATSATKLRRDIEGLRALAILLVLLYHAGLPFIPGGFVGVDVFFVISGYLITGLLLREISRTGRVSLVQFWARRIKRLLPASTLVLVATALATWALAPVTSWRSISGDIVAATVYVANWRFAGQSVDYLATDTVDSPVTHFWSLAVEEQYYVVWPLLIALVLMLTRRRAPKARLSALAWTLALIAVPSFILAGHLSNLGEASAFFTTTTRLWELAVGAAVAMAPALWSRLSPRGSAVVSFMGAAAIVASAVAYGSATPWPGPATLLPTLGAAMVIVGGVRGSDLAISRLLSTAPLVWLGGISYSVYLWHWPFLALGLGWFESSSPALGLALVALSFAPAWLSHKFIENPVRFHPFLRERNGVTLGIGAALMAVTIACALLLSHASSESATRVPRSAPGAVVLSAPGGEDEGEPRSNYRAFAPSLAEAAEDNADVYDDGCHASPEEDKVLRCTYGDADATTVVALVGDSHAAQWQPALRILAETRGWRLDTYTKSGCLFGAVEVWYDAVNRPYESCTRWNSSLLKQLAADPADVVIVSTSGGYSVAVGDEPVRRPAADNALVAGIAESWGELMSQSAVVALIDTPRSDIDVPDCLARNSQDARICAGDRASGVERSAAPLQSRAAEIAKPTLVVDLTKMICPREACAPVIGSVLVWRDGNHLTATYARTLASALGRELEKVAPLSD